MDHVGFFFPPNFPFVSRTKIHLFFFHVSRTNIGNVTFSGLFAFFSLENFILALNYTPYSLHASLVDHVMYP